MQRPRLIDDILKRYSVYDELIVDDRLFEIGEVACPVQILVAERQELRELLMALYLGRALVNGVPHGLIPDPPQEKLRADGAPEPVQGSREPINGS